MKIFSAPKTGFLSLSSTSPFSLVLESCAPEIRRLNRSLLGKALILALPASVIFGGASGHAAQTVQENICRGFEKSVVACELAQNFAQIRNRAAVAGQRLGMTIDATRFRDVMARQFINRSDFEVFLQKNGANPDPYCVYQPRPATWNNWQMTYETQVEPAAEAKVPLTEELLLKWNKMALVNTLAENIVIGEVKQYPNFGNNLKQSIALSPTEVEAVESIKLETVRRGLWVFGGTEKVGLKWSPMVCAEDLPAAVTLEQSGPECHKIFEDAQKFVTADPSNKFWADTLALADKPWDFKEHGKDYWFTYACWPRKAPGDVGRGKSCGMISYPDPKIVEVALKNILAQINHYNVISAKRNGVEQDPIAFAAVTQRRMVALHPFNKGNGRVSRWVMDYITLSHHLPPILVKDMDMDLSVPDEVYVQNAYDGSKESLRRMDACLKLYEAPGADVAALKNSACAMVEPTSDTNAVHDCQ